MSPTLKQQQHSINPFSRSASTAIMEDAVTLMEDATALMGGGQSPEGFIEMMMVDQNTPTLNNYTDKPQGLK